MITFKPKEIGLLIKEICKIQTAYISLRKDDQ